ncbi:MAG: carbon-nitrogen hydrolase family protein [Bacteroidota bacterium]
MKKSTHLAIVQESAVHLDLPKSMEKAVQLIQQAAAAKAEIIVFGETWLSGYPVWLDHCPDIARWNHQPTKEVFAKMYQNSVEVGSKETQLLCQLAKENKIVIVMGMNEIARTGVGNGTIYNTFLIIDTTGEIVCHRRKLMPTFTEKLVHGIGDGKDLHAVNTSAGRIGALICWEHWMPLTRMAMHESKEHIHFSLFPMVHEMHQVTCRQYAFEGRCFVVAVGQVMRGSDFPNQLKLPDYLEEDSSKMVLDGRSCVIAPDGSFLLEPQSGVEEIIFYTIDHMEMIYEESMSLDVTGHYNRRDVFDFKVNRERR